MDVKNTKPESEFLELSPEQVHRLIYRPLTDSADIVMLNKNLLKEKLSDIPVVEISRVPISGLPKRFWRIPYA